MVGLFGYEGTSPQEVYLGHGDVNRWVESGCQALVRVFTLLLSPTWSPEATTVFHLSAVILCLNASETGDVIVSWVKKEWGLEKKRLGKQRGTGVATVSSSPRPWHVITWSSVHKVCVRACVCVFIQYFICHPHSVMAWKLLVWLLIQWMDVRSRQTALIDLPESCRCQRWASQMLYTEGVTGFTLIQVWLIRQPVAYR